MSEEKTEQILQAFSGKLFPGRAFLHHLQKTGRKVDPYGRAVKAVTVQALQGGVSCNVKKTSRMILMPDICFYVTIKTVRSYAKTLSHIKAAGGFAQALFLLCRM
jgi:hypothetical protein